MIDDVGVVGCSWHLVTDCLNWLYESFNDQEPAPICQRSEDASEYMGMVQMRNRFVIEFNWDISGYESEYIGSNKPWHKYSANYMQTIDLMMELWSSY